MRRTRSEFPQLPTSFLDLLFGLIIVFATVSVLAWILINPIAEKGNITKKAEFLLTLSWPEGSIDIDTWILLPNGRTISFRSPELSLVNMERDDTGNYKDRMVINDELVADKTNIEYTTFRAIVPGEYIINVHLYGGGVFHRVNSIVDAIDQEKEKSDKFDNLPLTGNFLEPLPFHVKFEKLNPKIKLIFDTDGEFNHYREEVHVFRFTLTLDGDITDLRTDEPVKIVDDVINERN